MLGCLLQRFDSLLLLRGRFGLVALFKGLLRGSQGFLRFRHGLLGLGCFGCQVGNLGGCLRQGFAAFDQCLFFRGKVGEFFFGRVFGFVEDFFLLFDQGLGFFLGFPELTGLLELPVELDGRVFGKLTGTGEGLFGLFLVWFGHFGKIICQQPSGTLHRSDGFFKGSLQTGVLGLLLQIIDVLGESYLGLGDVLDAATLGGLFLCFNGELFLESLGFFKCCGHFMCVVDSLHLVPFELKVIELLFRFFASLTERFEGFELSCVCEFLF